jgi:hypothetical protein
VICARLAGSGLFRKEKKARRLRDLLVEFFFILPRSYINTVGFCSLFNTWT